MGTHNSQNITIVSPTFREKSYRNLVYNASRYVTKLHLLFIVALRNESKTLQIIVKTSLTFSQNALQTKQHNMILKKNSNSF